MEFLFDFDVSDAATRLPSERGMNALEAEAVLGLITDAPVRRLTALEAREAQTLPFRR